MLTEAAFALNDAVEEPEPTTTLAGTVNELELLASETLWPPDGAAELSETLQVVVPVPVKELLPHVSALTEGATTVPVPLTLTEAAVEALLEIVNCPDDEVALVG